jgi:hypothetical protein
MFVCFLKEKFGFEDEIKFSGGLENALNKFLKPGKIIVPVRGSDLSKKVILTTSWDKSPGSDSGVIGILVLDKKLFSIKRIRKQHSMIRKNSIISISQQYIETSLN